MCGSRLHWACNKGLYVSLQTCTGSSWSCCLSVWCCWSLVGSSVWWRLWLRAALFWPASLHTSSSAVSAIKSYTAFSGHLHTSADMKLALSSDMAGVCVIVYRSVRDVFSGSVNDTRGYKTQWEINKTENVRLSSWGWTGHTQWGGLIDMKVFSSIIHIHKACSNE